MILPVSCRGKELNTKTRRINQFSELLIDRPIPLGISHLYLCVFVPDVHLQKKQVYKVDQSSYIAKTELWDTTY